ncbi:MAG TPA: aldolase/citrate lyase family protein [Opitutaceae bacterium]|nr:aldolase/citrate lyase family protein [Opitutaceae bacterium]
MAQQQETSPSPMVNPLRERLARGEFVIGATLMVPSVETAAQVAALGFDFLWVEMEHSPITLETFRMIVLATRGLPAMPFARVPVAELWTAKRVLDSGALGVIFPFVNTPALAETAAAACRYPPVGRRGSGAGLANFRWPVANYYQFADENVLCVAMIERPEAVEAAEVIAATPGVDVLFIGVSDLSFALGLQGRQDEPRLQEAIAKVSAAAKKHGKYLGRPALDAESIQKYHAAGFQFFQGPTDIDLLRVGARSLLTPSGRFRQPNSAKEVLY